MTGGPFEPASLPPAGLPGLEPAWSRLVTTVDADGVDRTFHVLDSGGTDAEVTLLCVHGNPTWSYLWRDLVAAGGGRWRVVAVDALDMGFSERTGTLRRLERRIDDLDAVTSRLGIDGPVVTVAHDWGGPISLGWAQRHPDRVTGIVLINTGVAQPDGSRTPGLIRLARTPALLRRVCVDTPIFVRGALAMARPRLEKPVREAFSAPYRTAARRRAIGEFVADIPVEPDHPTAETLHRIAEGLTAMSDVPALLVWGASDPVFSDRFLVDLQARLPRAVVHRFASAGHLVVEDADVSAAVLDWIDGNTMPPTTVEPGGDESLRRPLWAALDERRSSNGLAIAEMAADGGGAIAASVTFSQLAVDVDRLAAGMLSLGIRQGDRVALLVPPGVDLAASLYACWRIGAVVVVADAGLGLRGMSRALRSARPGFVIGIPKALVAATALRWPGRRIAAGPMRLPATLIKAETTLDDLRRTGDGMELPPGPSADAEAAVAFTSGATGPAKGVVYRHRQLEAQRDVLERLYEIGAHDRLVAAFAPFALYGPAMGIASVVPDMDVTSPGTLSAQALADAAGAIDATMVFASPAALANVSRTSASLDEEAVQDLRGVRLLLSAGAPVSARLLERASSLMPNAEAHTPYGMTEVLPVADITLAGIDEAGSGNGVCVGYPVAEAEVAVRAFGADGVPTGDRTFVPGVSGEICVRAAHGKDHYDKLWLTERAASDDGWHFTGDVGHLDELGRLWVEGRLAHIITTPHGVVTPVGVEHRVEELAGVRLAAAVGVGPPGTQQVVVVVETDGSTRRPHLADRRLTTAIRGLVPVGIAAVLVVPELPVDIRHNSKIDRGRLATWAGSVLAGGRMRRP